MPKEALPSAEWMTRLRGFANGTFKFAKGQNPRKDSKWYKKLQKIRQCPMHNSQGVIPLFATRPLCNCGYHVSNNNCTCCVIICMSLCNGCHRALDTSHGMYLPLLVLLTLPTLSLLPPVPPLPPPPLTLLLIQ